MAHAVFLGLGRLRQEARDQPVLHMRPCLKKPELEWTWWLAHAHNPSTWEAD